MTEYVSIKGLDKAKVFAALYNNTHPQGSSFIHFVPGDISSDTAREWYGDCNEYYDYVRGRVMKVDLSSDNLSPWGYDRDNYDGAAAAAIEPLRT